MKVTAKLLLTAVILFMVSGCSENAEVDSTEFASSSSYLTSAVRDILGDDVGIISLTGPGNCPGHFDISPRQVACVSQCALLFRLDFQSSFDAKLSQAVDRGLRIIEIKPAGGLCVPKTYLDVCRQVGNALVESKRLSRESADKRLKQIESRIKEIVAEVKKQVKSSSLVGANVLASNHQMEFCRYLELNVVAFFTGSDDPALINNAVSTGRDNAVKAVIGNVPQGARVPQRLADELGAACIMFENFPADKAEGYDEMLRTNIDRLWSDGGN